MNIYDLISRAQKLRKETQLDSVSPDRVGGLHEDTLKYINEFQLLASSPSLHKAYASVSAMQSDKSPKSDLTGKPLKPGQLVVIVPANQTDATAGDVYRYDGPSGNTSAWTFVAKIGAVPADAELSATSTNPPQNKVVTEKLTELESEVVNSAFLDGGSYSRKLVKNSNIYSQTLGRLQIEKGKLYNIELRFANPLEKNVAVKISMGEQEKTYTIGVTATSYTIRASYAEDGEAILRYSTIDTANDVVYVNITSENDAISEVSIKQGNSDSMLLDKRVIGSVNGSGNGEVEYILPSPIIKGRQYRIKATIPSATVRLYTRLFDSNNNVDLTPLFSSPLYNYEWSFVASGNADRLMLYMGESTNYNVEVVEYKKPLRQKLIGKFSGNGSGDQFFDLTKQIEKGKQYAIFVSTASISTNQISTSWNKEKIDSSPVLYFALNGYEFNFIASRNANKVCLYNGKASQYTLEVYEILSLTETTEKQSFVAPRTTMKPIMYIGDDKSDNNFLSNGIVLKNGNILAGRPNGVVVRIEDDSETIVLNVESPTATKVEWRLFFQDSNGNIYASPGEFSGADIKRGIYRKQADSETFSYVKDLNRNVDVNDATIWAMTEDKEGNLYAGIYAVASAWPIILKSTDGGLTWNAIVDFRNYNADARHIHWVEYSKWADALYCIVGEINTIYKSIDGGKTWNDLKIELSDKGCGAICTENGIIVGTDSSRHLELYLLRYDDTTLTKVFQGWANMCFSIRKSDYTGYLYAFSVIDVSALKSDLYPPLSVFDSDNVWDGIAEWKNTLITEYGESLGNRMYNNWYAYYDSVKDKYPDDAIVPRHYGILYSDDGGLTWKVLQRWFLETSNGGCNNASLFFNGECLVGRQYGIFEPIVISEGKHQYRNGGCDVSGEIFGKTNDNKIVHAL